MFGRGAWTARRACGALGVVLLVLVATMLSGAGRAAAFDHRDGPVFVQTATNGRRDVTGLYVFRSPANANNTVFVMTVAPFAGNVTPTSFDPSLYYDIKIATDPTNVRDDLTVRVSFGPPDASGVQDVLVRGLPVASFPPIGILAQGKTRQNLPVSGGGTFRAAGQDDSFFFDQGAFDAFIAAAAVAFPRPVGVAHNFYGPSANTLAIVLEIPSAVIGSTNAIIGVWARTELNGLQQDRVGRPGINTLLIPPVPRNNLTRGERRTAVNVGHPGNDRLDFRADMVAVLQGFYGRTPADAGAIADLLLPDLLVFQLGNPNGFGTFVSGPGGTFLGNGRRLSDDTVDVLLTVLTNGAITTDNVGDDNALKVTDGSVDPVSGMTRAIAFPYIGAANASAGGPNP